MFDLDNRQETKHGQHHDLSIYENLLVDEQIRQYKVHIRVHVDTSYAEQSWARIDVYSHTNLGWNRLADILPMKVGKNPHDTADVLRDIAAKILY